MIEEEAELPLLFLVPPGWPEPDIHWRASHQGWIIPQGWVPRADVRPAPVGWKFWRKNLPVWNPMVALRRRGPLIRLWVGIGLVALGFSAFSIQVALGGHFEIVWIFAAIVGLGLVLEAISVISDGQSLVLHDIQESAVEAKRAIDLALYSEYLRTWRR